MHVLRQVEPPPAAPELVPAAAEMPAADSKSMVAETEEMTEASQPVHILKEFWGPKGRGRNRYAQRIFQVLLADGSKVNCVAEDVVNGWDEPFEENEFYSAVLRDWRLEHGKPPRPP